MNAVPPTFTPAAGTSPGDCADRWAAVEQAARVVALLAALEPDDALADSPALAGLIDQAEAWRRERAGQAVADLAAIMEHGLAALLAVNARGADPRPAAEALWHEFLAARDAIRALLPAPREGAERAQRDRSQPVTE